MNKFSIPSLSISKQSVSPKNSNTPKIVSHCLKAINAAPLKIKINQTPERIITPKLKNIEFDHRFKIRKTLIEERARSTSPKLRGEGNNNNNNHNILEDNGLVKKYKKIRLENQEIQIKIRELYCDLVRQYSQGMDMENCVENSLQIIEFIFQ